MAYLQHHTLPTPPASAASPAPSNASISNRGSSLPTPRSHRLQPGSQEIALINYLDNHILRITRRYAKKFSTEGLVQDDTPGYTAYEEFVTDVDPLVDVVWISGTPSLQIPYLLQLAGLASSYLYAFPFSTAVLPLTNKIDQGFSTILQSARDGTMGSTATYDVNTTEKVRIKSLIEETRIAVVNAASSSGNTSSIQDISGTETEDEDTDESDDDDDDQDMSISLALSRVYKRTLEILGDSLIIKVPPQPQDDDIRMT